MKSQYGFHLKFLNNVITCTVCAKILIIFQKCSKTDRVKIGKIGIKYIGTKIGT